MVDGRLARGARPAEDSPPAREELTDPQLLECFVKQQDEAAFAVLVRRHGPMVLGVCRRVLDHAQDAEDACQATFLVLVRRASSIGRPELLGNWLYGVAFRIARKARAQAARRTHTERQLVPMATTDPLLEVAWRELRSLLDEELQRLPLKFRAPLILCYLEGLSNEEAARRLGWPPGSISYRLARGRELLRQRLKDRHRALPSALFAALLARNAAPDQMPSALAELTVQAGMGLAGLKPLAPGLISPSVGLMVARALKAMAEGKWRGLGAILVAALLLALLATGVLAYAGLAGGPAPGISPGPAPLLPAAPASLGPPGPGHPSPPSCH